MNFLPQLEPAIEVPPPVHVRVWGFLRAHLWLEIFLVGTLLIIGGVIFNRLRPHPVTYETVAAKDGTITQTVTATGAVKAASEVQLDFQVAGRVVAVNVAKGAQVKAGDVLAAVESTNYTLNAKKAQSQLQQAQAELAKAAAGATTQQIFMKRAAVDEAAASLAQASTTAENSVRQSVLDAQSASLNVEQKQADYDAKLLSSVDNLEGKRATVARYELLLPSDLYSADATLTTALTDMDNLLGVDSTMANDDFESLLGSKNASTYPAAQVAYQIARDARNLCDSALQRMGNSTDSSLIDDASTKCKNALSQTQIALNKTRTMLTATAPGGSLTVSALTTKMGMIDGDRAAVTGKMSAVNADATALTMARLDVSAAQHTDAAMLLAAKLALQKAKQEVTSVTISAETKQAANRASLLVAQSRLSTAKADYANVTAPLRSVDRAPYVAAIASAQASADAAIADIGKTEIIAPMDGIITAVPIAVGQIASGRTSDAKDATMNAAITLLADHLEVTADIPETDVNKVAVGQTVDMTFDAFGQDKHFSGTVLTINPAQTVVQDIVYYRMHIVLTTQLDTIRPGMTANVSVQTARKEHVILVPQRAVHQDAQGRYVQILVNNLPVTKRVSMGLRGDEGMVEIVSGVSVNDQIILTQTK